MNRVRLAGAFVCSAAFAGGVANQAGLARGFVAGLFVFSMSSLGVLLTVLIRQRLQGNRASASSAERL